MNAHEFSDAYWTARIAPYALAVALTGLLVSLFWNRPPLGYSIIALFSGALVFFFHALRWRTGRAIFGLAAMASAFVPLFALMSRLRLPEGFQYVATFMATYALGVVFFRHRILRGLKH